jgi:hypothetical protein
MQVAGILGVGLIGVVILFQVGLVLGAPWGAAAWGGQHTGTLPVRLRIASVVAIVILGFLAWLVAAAAGIVAVAPLPATWLIPAIWVAAAYFALGAVVNLISRSPIERVWAPVALATAICCVIVAAG